MTTTQELKEALIIDFKVCRKQEFEKPSFFSEYTYGLFILTRYIMR